MSGHRYQGVSSSDPAMRRKVDDCTAQLNDLCQILSDDHKDTEPVAVAMLNVLCDMLKSAEEDNPPVCSRLLDAIATVMPANFPSRFSVTRVH